jgi:hypothetical protein
MKSPPMLSLIVTPVIACAALIAFARPAAADVEVTVNGSGVDLAPPAIIRAGRVFVPLRGVFEQLGASVVYSDGTINATGNGRDISLNIGSTQATVNDQEQTIDVAPFLIGARTYVPLRFISEALGDSVNWDEADHIAAIDSGGGAADYYAPGTASYVDTPPPEIPDYEQPDVPAPNEIWQPGYWAWGSYGYYWVPGTWVQAPQPGYLWTPGYWQWNNYGYVWNPGYWAIAIGFYGGVNYGCGYFGHGYSGGRWSHDAFEYNTYVTHVDREVIHNVYIDRSVDVAVTNRIAYNGGNGGLADRPSAAQLAVGHERHLGMTKAQQLHLATAESDRRLLASVNKGKPPIPAVAQPLSRSHRPVGFVPVTTRDRIDPQAHVTPVHVPAARAARAPSAGTASAPRALPPQTNHSDERASAPHTVVPAHVVPPARVGPSAAKSEPHAVTHAHAAAPPVAAEPPKRAAPTEPVAPPERVAPPEHVAPPERAAPPATRAEPAAAPAYHRPAVYPAPVRHAPPADVAPPPRAAPAHAAPPHTEPTVPPAPVRRAAPQTHEDKDHKPPR